MKIDLKLYECSLVFYTAPRNKRDELNPSPYHCNISASYFTFSFRNCQLFVCRHSNSSTSFRFLLAAKLWLGHTRVRERLECTWRLVFCGASFVTQNHYAEIHIFNLFIHMRVKKKYLKTFIAILEHRWKDTLFNP